MSDIGISISTPLFANVGVGLLFLAKAFLIGSIPFGVIVGRVFYRSDLRESGSGNIGAANALRSFGKIGGAAVLLLDASKGYVAASLLTLFWPLVAAWTCHCSVNTPADVGDGAMVGLAAVAGHCFSPWLRFRGGKGVATWLGVLFALSWLGGLLFIAIWLVVVVPSRYASLGSTIASLVSPLVLWLISQDSTATLCATIAALLILWKHRENIGRLREGRENKITFGRTAA